MKKRISKKIERKRREAIHKVLDLNGLSEREQELTGDKPTAFFSFSGHVAAITVGIYKDGWTEGIKDGLILTHYLGEDFGSSLETISQRLVEVSNGL